jgi:CRP-like cAMP-binding protein
VHTGTVPERIVRELRSLRERHDAELRKLIRRSARAGIRSQDIADAIGISRATLWRRYGLELHRGDRRS